ncbi:MAG: hypothetical protein J5815_01645 [Clostridia bacterium]|nr:hypothetical protein [Clostridia bacterium]
MEDFAKKYLDWYKGLSKIVRALLCLLWDVPSNLYRFSKSALKKNTLGIVLAIVFAIFGGWILFVVDFVCILVMDKVLWLDDFGAEDEAKADEPKEEAPAAEPAEEPAPEKDAE